jgi:hypothetical protein
METILARISAGESLVRVLRDDGMPVYQTVMNWIGDDADLLDKYMRAREASADADADRVKDVADRTLAGEYDPQAARVAIDALKWSAGKRKPKVYGDKLDVNHGGGITVNMTPDDANL